MMKKLNGISVEEQQTEKSCSSKEDITAKLFRYMFVSPEKQAVISEMEEIMKRFPFKKSK